MMNEFIGTAAGRVEPFPETRRPAVVSDELAQIRKLLLTELPYASNVTFEFDGTLKAHIDIRNREEIVLVEERLKHIGGGHLFSHASRGLVPNHPFLHRITARLDR
jgi:hypothetical protein